MRCIRCGDGRTRRDGHTRLGGQRWRCKQCRRQFTARSASASSGRGLRRLAEMARLFAAYPEALARTLEIASRCRFALDELRYEYPDEIAPGGEAPQHRLERLAWEGAARRWPGGVPAEWRERIVAELALIARQSHDSPCSLAPPK